MSVEWVKLSRRLARKNAEAFETVKRDLCSQVRLAVLFGSRSRGEHTPLSDYDVLVVKAEPSPAIFQRMGPVQVFSYGEEEIRKQLTSFNTVVLDALLEGVLLCGDKTLFEGLKSMAGKVVEERAVRKTEAGWMPAARS